MRPLTRAQYCRVIDIGTPSVIAYEAARLTLTGWENFNDSDGNTVPWNISEMSANIERLPQDLLMSLAADALGKAQGGEAGDEV